MMVTYMDSKKDIFDDSPATGPKVDLESFSQALQRRDLLGKVNLPSPHSPSDPSPPPERDRFRRAFLPTRARTE